MADFAALATSYVLADSDDEQQHLAGQAADAIRTAPRKSAAVLGWAQSIDQWMPKGGDDADSDVIVRAKALGFLAATLEVLDPDVLRAEQVEHLVAFFGAMFAVDHKAGILAASTALRCLCTMSHFRPSMAATVLGHVVKLGDDFRLQVPATRRAIYDLVALLVRDDAALRSLSQTDGADGPYYLTGLLQLCRSERDPDNLLRWFAILRRVLDRSDPPLPSAVVQDVFRAASDYFPISMRASATPAGTTVDDLKTALRGVFASSSAAVSSVFDFLLQKMDQGDALTVSVKVDVLRTIRACVETYPQPAQTIVPYTSRIWNALKYEVRHGDVPETIDGTLRVVQAIATRLNGITSVEAATTTTDTPHSDAATANDGVDVAADGAATAAAAAAAPVPTATPLEDFTVLVLADCIADLANSTFTKPAGQLLTSAMLGGFRAYNLMVGAVIGAVKKDLQQAQTAGHTRDLVGVLNSVLRTRSALVARSESDMAVAAAFHDHDAAIRGLLDTLYLRLWDSSLQETAPRAESSRDGPSYQDPLVRNEVIRGLAALVVQRGPLTMANGTTTTRALLCSPAQCDRVFATLTPAIMTTAELDEPSSLALALSLAPTPAENQAMAHEAMMALVTAAAVYPAGFAFLVQRTIASISRDAPSASPESLASMRDMLSRVAYIGCSAIPDVAVAGHSDGTSINTDISEALAHFLTLTSALRTVLEQLLDAKASFPVSSAVFSGIYGAALHLRDAFAQRGAVASTGHPKSKTLPSPTSPPSVASEGEAVLFKLFQAYLKEASSLVRRLYLRATTVKADSGSSHDQLLGLSADFDLSSASAATRDDQDQYLHQLSDFAAFVLRDLDEVQQQDEKLFEAPFHLFHTESKGRPSFFHDLEGGRADVLSLGILRGLWPSAVASFADLGISPLNLLDDMDTLERLPARTHVVRNKIATVVANKYSAAASTGASNTQHPGNLAAWQATVEAVKMKLDDNGGAAAITPHRFARLVALAAGAFARLDKDARPLAGLLVAAPAHRARQDSGAERAAQQMARALGWLLISSDRTLSSADHAVVKSIYRQWVYGQTVKTLLPLAFPRKTAAVAGDDDEVAMARTVSTVHTLSILALVRGMPFSVYEDDVSGGGSDGAPLVRVLVAATTTLAPQWSDVAVALRILAAILAENRADAVRGHLKTVIDAAIRVFGLSSPTPPPAARKAALSLVALLPTHYEEGLLLPYEPRLARAMALACGDGVREIREVAQRARESWTKVAA